MYVDGKGNLYLFGKLITNDTMDDELKKIIKETPEGDYNGYTAFEGEWIVPRYS